MIPHRSTLPTPIESRPCSCAHGVAVATALLLTFMPRPGLCFQDPWSTELTQRIEESAARLEQLAADQQRLLQESTVANEEYRRLESALTEPHASSEPMPVAAAKLDEMETAIMAALQKKLQLQKELNSVQAQLKILQAIDVDLRKILESAVQESMRIRENESRERAKLEQEVEQKVGPLQERTESLANLQSQWESDYERELETANQFIRALIERRRNALAEPAAEPAPEPVAPVLAVPAESPTTPAAASVPPPESTAPTTPTASTSAPANIVVIDDFDGAADGDILSSLSNVYQMSPSTIGMQLVQDSRDEHSTGVLKLTYEKKADRGPGNPGGWCGYYSVIKDRLSQSFFDASGYRFLTCWLKGTTGRENFVIGLADKRLNARGESLKSQPITEYLAGKTIGRRWQKLSIPLRDFPVDLTTLASVTIGFESACFPKGQSRGAVLVDHLAFEP